MPIKCPHCNSPIELEIVVNPKKPSETILFITRKEYSDEISKPVAKREFNILDYDSEKDRFRVTRRIK